MFTRLFFIEGHGLKHFKKFSDEKSVFGGRIIVWKVDWKGTESNIMDEFKEKPLNETINKTTEEGFEEETPDENISNEIEITEEEPKEEKANDNISAEEIAETESSEDETTANKANITIK